MFNVKQQHEHRAEFSFNFQFDSGK